jgi:hypothetical protein
MMQLVLIFLTKRKEMILYCQSFGYGDQCTFNKRFYRSNRVSIPAEEGSIIPIMGISHHPHHGYFTHCPTAKHKQPNNLINRKEDTHKSLIVLQKPQTTK